MYGNIVFVQTRIRQYIRFSENGQCTHSVETLVGGKGKVEKLLLLETSVACFL